MIRGSYSFELEGSRFNVWSTIPWDGRWVSTDNAMLEELSLPIARSIQCYCYETRGYRTNKPRDSERFDVSRVRWASFDWSNLCKSSKQVGPAGRLDMLDMYVRMYATILCLAIPKAVGAHIIGHGYVSQSAMFTGSYQRESANSASVYQVPRGFRKTRG
jgi:hypothetical protein